MNVLVTGGAGYVGSVLCCELLAAGNSVTVLDRFDYGIEPLLACGGRVRIVRGDVCDETAMAAAAAGQDAIVHLAAMVGYPLCMKHPEEARRVHVEGTRQVVRFAEGRKLIFASTGSVYGAVESRCTEDGPVHPMSIYARTKYEAERQVIDAGGVALRFATLFGISPCMRFDLLPNDFTRKAITLKYLVLYEATAMRTFLHVHDAARAYLCAIDAYDAIRGQVFNVGDERLNLSKSQVAQAVSRQYPMYLHVADIGKDADGRDYAVDYGKVRRMLGFQARILIDEGIQEVGTFVTNMDFSGRWRC